jgi:hypothetical protein
MKWLKRKLRKWVREAEEDYSGERGMAVKSIDSTNSPDTDPVLTFRIYSAVNGQILEFRRYDRKSDRNDNSTYLIPKDESVGEYVNKCLSMELLK